MDKKAISVLSPVALILGLFFSFNVSAVAVKAPDTQPISEVSAHSTEQTRTEQTSTEQNMAQSAIVSEQWARATFALAKAGAAYMTLQNISDSEIQLVSVSVDESVAGMVELHHTKMSDGMMQMQELEDGVVISENESVKFIPGGKHIMLMGLAGPLDAGKEITITLQFADGSELSQVFPIKDARNVKM